MTRPNFTPTTPDRRRLTTPPPPITHNETVNHPPHYRSSPSGVECIDVVEHMNFCRGNAIKYIWRAGEKNPDAEIEDLEKARWYIAREIERLKKARAGQ